MNSYECKRYDNSCQSINVIEIIISKSNYCIIIFWCRKKFIVVVDYFDFMISNQEITKIVN